MKLYNENFEIVDIDDAAVDKMKQFCWEPKEVECSPYTSYNGRATFAYCRDSGFVSRIIDGEYADFYETDKWAVDALAKAVMDDDYDDDVWYSMDDIIEYCDSDMCAHCPWVDECDAAELYIGYRDDDGNIYRELTKSN